MHKIVLLLVALVSFLSAQSYTDMLGRIVEVKGTAKLVFIGPGALRLGVYLGLDNRLVGIEQIEKDASPFSPYRTYLGKDRIDKLPLIGTGGPGKMPDLEALVVLKPDLVIASFVDKNMIDLIVSKTGIPVLALSYGATYGGNEKQLHSIKNSLLLLGKVTKTLPKAEVLVAFLNEQEKRLSSLKLTPKRIYIGGIGYKGAQGISSTEANYSPFEMLGFKNCLFEGSETIGHQFIDFEALLKANPEIIFIDKFGKAKVDEDYNAKKALFHTLSAYQTHNVKEVLGYNFYSTNIENLFIVAWQVAFMMGADVNMQKEANAIYNAFYGEKGEPLLHKLSYGFGAL